MSRRGMNAVLAEASRAGATQAAQPGRAPRLHQFRGSWHVALFVLPAVALVVLFYVVPNVLAFILGLTDWSSAKSRITFVGLRNFEYLISTGALWATLWTTIKFAVFVMVIENLVALSLALALEAPTRLNVFLRSVFFLPVLVSSLAAGYVFVGVFQSDGVANGILSGLASLVGLPPVQIPWLGSRDYTLLVVGAVLAWRWGGIHMLVYLAGLKAIPHEVVEAARMDGASAFQVIRHVKLPLLGPAFTFNITLTLIGALSAFEIILATTNGGPGTTTEVLNLAIFRQFGQGYFGFAAALSAVLLVVILLVAIPLIVHLRRREVEL
jgi:raffinose/stachyose/melibiose transport system permease protein